MPPAAACAPLRDPPVKRTAHDVSRRRGFEAPFGPTFIGTVAAFLLLSSTHYALYVPCVHWVWFTAASALLCVAVLSWLFVALYNPVDPYCRANAQTTDEGLKYCNHCACYTSKHARTRHCYDCRKCVQGFDHHCVYLQTCIGKNNYPVFFTLITSVWLWCVLVAALDVFLAIPASYAPFAQPLNYCTANPRSAGWYIALLSLHALVCVGAFVVVSSLLLFHVIICLKGQTTYEWLVEDIQKKRTERAEGVKPLRMRIDEWREKMAAALATKFARSSSAVSTTRAGSKASAGEVKQTQPTSTEQVAINMKR
eukprot:CAMPEP_0179941038 /NCGR_PEP_ID=MMETSP0983-20121128/16703_1 /TAXON_ID=483367 /ORGANISM="non described non described, Strain CCMP 2436" /LENGTH=310 /DNA_ID=CAMNT_0021847913 /DNA_START=23 /DNA_END=955 /DNA_ORIENTATION=+